MPTIRAPRTSRFVAVLHAASHGPVTLPEVSPTTVSRLGGEHRAPPVAAHGTLNPVIKGRSPLDTDHRGCRQTDKVTLWLFLPCMTRLVVTSISRAYAGCSPFEQWRQQV